MLLKLFEYLGVGVGGERNEKSRSPDIHNAVGDDKGYGDSFSSLCLGLGVTLCGTHCQVKGSCSLKEGS